MDHLSETLRGWAMRQVGYWPRLHFEAEEIRNRLSQLSEKDEQIIIFEIANGTVSVSADPSGPRNGADPKWRGLDYQEFIQEVVTNYCPDISVPLGIFLGDTGVPSVEIPVFAFQKPLANQSLLVPDVDLISGGFTTLQGYRDLVAYSDKAISATFVGTTTGGWIDEQVARDRGLPRLRAAAFFRGHPDVDFQLPKIAQASSGGATILREQGIGDGMTVPWSDQCKHRFIISMDGNGATCSRVLLALLSNSVLVKYNSPHELHYFDGMRPWYHYVPVDCDQDVLNIIEMERRHPGMFANIARMGRQFALSFLAKDPTMRYTGELLQMYSAVVNGPAPLARDVSIVAHIGNVGDISSQDGRVGQSNNQIQGFRIDLAGPLKPSDLTAVVITADGITRGPQSASMYSGTRGQNLPLVGFSLTMSEAACFQYSLTYCGWFEDGSVIGPVGDGEMCRSQIGTPLCIMEVSIGPKAA